MRQWTQVRVDQEHTHTHYSWTHITTITDSKAQKMIISNISHSLVRYSHWKWQINVCVCVSAFTFLFSLCPSSSSSFVSFLEKFLLPFTRIWLTFKFKWVFHRSPDDVWRISWHSVWKWILVSVRFGSSNGQA